MNSKYRSLRIISIVLISSLSLTLMSQPVKQKFGFTYTGEFFEDPDWGMSYNTSEADRTLLNSVHQVIKSAANKIVSVPGDYTSSVNDMSFAFDPKMQEENRRNGSKCVTCYYSQNPNSGNYFQYGYNIRLEMVEESKTAALKLRVEDSLMKAVQKASASKKSASNAAANEKKLQEEMEKLQKEIESTDVSRLTEAQLADFEKKSKRLQDMANGNEKDQKIPEDSLHEMYGSAYASKIDVWIRTNEYMLQQEKNKLTSLKSNPGFYYKELQIPGCTFACIYFDKYNKSSDLKFSHNPVFLAYSGPVFSDKNSLPKPWIIPFCHRVTFEGNLQQIMEIYPKLDFVKLKEVLN